VGSSYSGVLSSDDFTAYNGYPVTAQQKCQAHLPRHFKRLIKIPGLNHQKIGTKFIDLIDEGFKPTFGTLTVTDSSTRELKLLQGRKGLIRTSMMKMAIEWENKVS
jgi:transposase